MYVDFYGLEKEPFHITPDPEFLYLSPCHKEAFATILYGVEKQKGFVVISGEVGTGKTTILRSYLKQLKRTKIRPLYIFDPDVSFEELLEAILHEFEYGEPDTSQFTRLQWLRHKLIDEYDAGSTVVLMIDEAQNMPVETLEKLRVLTNLETPTDKLMQVLLVGQPELEEKLALHQLRQLNQRVAVRAKLHPLSKSESRGYIRYRVNQAGGKAEQIFTDGALSLIIRHCKGNPRRLNIVCDNALISGYGGQKRPVTAGVVRDVIRELSGSPFRWQMRKVGIAASILAGFALVGAAGWYGMRQDATSNNGTEAVAKVETDSTVAVTPRVDEKAILRQQLEARYETATPEPVVALPIAPETTETIESTPVVEIPDVDEAPMEATLAEPVVAAPEVVAEVVPEAVVAPPEEADALAGELARLSPVPEAPVVETKVEVAPPEVAPAPEPTPVAEVMVAEALVEVPMAAPTPAPAPEAALVVDESNTVRAKAQPVQIVPPHSENSVTKATDRIQVSPGDTLTQLITNRYGTCNQALIAAVTAANPRIVKPDVIYYGDALVFPPLEEVQSAQGASTDQPG